MKNLTLTLLVFIALEAQSQIVFPATGGDTSNLLEQILALDTPEIKKAIEPFTPEVASTDPVIQKNEAEVKKLSLEAQKIKLEQEIAELKGKANLTPEEALLLKIKNENLTLLAQKENFLLEQEFNQIVKAGNQKKYPKGEIYGQNFFRDEAFNLIDKSSEVVAPENYVIGSGDVVQLEVWGFRYWSKSYTVSESGSIDISGYQKVFVKGLTLKQARNLVGSRLGLGGNESSYSLNVTRPRTVSVTVLGEVFNPGTYTVTATNSAFNVLASMGGPTNIGSVRNIYIKRDGKIRDSFDTYEYFNNVLHPRDVFLQNNDYIIVMPSARQVQVFGSVRRPGTYELKSGEGLLDLIQFAGGTYPNTYYKDITVSRIRNNAYEVVSVNLDSLKKLKKDFVLAGGESVTFKSINSDNQYVALIQGAVSVPGTYRIRKGMTLGALIKNANGLTSDAFVEKAYIVRTHEDFSKSYLTFSPKEIVAGKTADMEIEDRDSVYIFRSTDLKEFYTVSVNGPVHKPLTTRYINGLTLGDLLFMAGGLTEDADLNKGFIVRTNADFRKQLIPFSPDDIINKREMYNLEIMPKDEITLFSKSSFLRTYSLTIQGAVKSPKTLDFTENTRVSDLVSIAGGLEISAYRKRALIIHEDLYTGIKSARTINLDQIIENPTSNSNFLLQKNDVVRVFDLAELKNDFAVTVYGEVRQPGSYEFADNMSLQNLIDLAGGVEFIAAGTQVEIVRNLFLKDGYYQFLKPEVIVSKITDNLLLDSGLNDLYLQPFDKVFIRRNPNFIALKMVYVDGAVMYPGYYALQSENDKLSSIFERAGGFRPDAMLSGIKMERTSLSGATVNVIPNGRKAVKRKKSRFNVIVKGGDKIDVPYSENLVFIAGDLNKETENEIGAFYQKGKRARYYVRNFGGGFTRSSDRRKLVVIHSNGARVGTRNYVLFKIYPKVKEGSRIVVNTRPSSNPKNKVDLDLMINRLVTRATAVLTLIGLYKVATAR